MKVFFLIKILFISQRENTQAGDAAETDREKQAFPLSREPYTGFNPRILGPWPELKANAQAT